MFNYIFRRKDVPIDEVMTHINQLRDNFSRQIDIYEFEWVNYALYVSLRTTSDVARVICSRYGFDQYDQWNIQYDD